MAKAVIHIVNTELAGLVNNQAGVNHRSTVAEAEVLIREALNAREAKDTMTPGPKNARRQAGG